jgi:DNA-binding GntR family transcriptional regulator
MVHTVLQQRILDGILRPGERIDLDAIAQELAVSRTPVRTALRQLESEGLVTIYPHRAVMVSELSADDLEQMYAVRIHLESFAAELAVPKLTVDDLA